MEIQTTYINPTMLMLISSKAQIHKDIENPLNPYDGGIHLMALVEHSQMSPNVPGFQSLLIFSCIILYWLN